MKTFLVLILVFLVRQQDPGALHYGWKHAGRLEDRLVNRIRVPAGYTRVSMNIPSFGYWLRNIPLKPGKPEVHLYNGQRKVNQTAHEAVIDIDVSKKDLQQCADAVMRLRGEYLFSMRDFESIHFNFTNGFRFDYPTWRNGGRVKISGNQVRWVNGHPVDTTHSGFRAYLEMAFTYCGTASLSKEVKKISMADLQAGDLFIKGGSPGHAVVVMDVAHDVRTGKKIFLLAQSYMPAQDLHLLKNPTNERLSPWYSADFRGPLVTPEWTFTQEELMRFE